MAATITDVSDSWSQSGYPHDLQEFLEFQKRRTTTQKIPTQFKKNKQSNLRLCKKDLCVTMV